MSLPFYQEAAGSAASPAFEYAQRLFGGGVAVAESDVIVGTTPVRLCTNNPNRLSLVIVNNGSSQLTVSWASTVTTLAGIPIGQNGGSLQLLIFEDGELPTRELFAVAPAAGQSIHVVEVLRT